MKTEIILKSISALLIANILFILVNGYVDLSFQPIISKLLTDPNTQGFRALYLMLNCLIYFAILGFISTIEDDKKELKN